ncbi:hypothetical protein CHARACLAT_027540 [Characodon lateralis]|uniref:Uncharacterized protein n=1 Tax=Characodon lateralis TaxID=208331 RepID=A0ABU7CUT5_9TELE|nr:hypothetical protein [Characodon lateralis]
MHKDRRPGYKPKTFLLQGITAPLLPPTFSLLAVFCTHVGMHVITELGKKPGLQQQHRQETRHKEQKSSADSF